MTYDSFAVAGPASFKLKFDVAAAVIKVCSSTLLSDTALVSLFQLLYYYLLSLNRFGVPVQQEPLRFHLIGYKVGMLSRSSLNVRVACNAVVILHSQAKVRPQLELRDDPVQFISNVRHKLRL